MTTPVLEKVRVFARFSQFRHFTQKRFSIIVDYEVTQMFEDMVSDWFTQEDTGYNDFIKALLAGDLFSLLYITSSILLLPSLHRTRYRRRSAVHSLPA